MKAPSEAAPKYVSGSVNEILETREVRTYAVAHTDSTGRRRIMLVQRFGKFDDGKDAFFVLASPQDIENQLKIPSKTLLDKLRAQLSQDPDEIPEHDLAEESLLGAGDE